MTRTEIENYVKARCTYLTSRKHIIPESSGKKINIDGRVLYLNIKEDIMWKTTRLHSITTKIQTATTK